MTERFANGAADRPAGRPASPMARLMAAVEAVSRALEEEAAAMTAGQPEPLMEAVGAKSRALKQLESLTRESWVKDLLAGNSGASGSDDVQRLMAGLQRCERQNLATGSAIVTARRDNELLLRALGYEPRSGAYTARGHTPNEPAPRTLGKA